MLGTFTNNRLQRSKRYENKPLNESDYVPSNIRNLCYLVLVWIICILHFYFFFIDLLNSEQGNIYKKKWIEKSRCPHIVYRDWINFTFWSVAG